jgi:hypothetical protein
MKIGMKTLSLIPLSVVSFCGCSPSSFVPYSQLNAFGAKELVDRATFEQIDLVKLLQSAGAAANQSPASTNSSSVGQSQSSNPATIDEAFRAFYGTMSTDLELSRNRVQERILGASTQRCAAYTRFLKQFESEVGFGLGAIATALAGAGAIFTPATTVRALSGAAAITSGVNAEFDEKLFARLTIQVITKAIDSRRSEIYKGIAEKQGKLIKDYPVEAAVKDALYYHGACSLLSGLEQAAASIERADDPGIKRLKNIFAEITDARLASENLTALAGGNDNDVVLPLATFNKAGDARDRLTGIEKELKAVMIPSTVSQDKATVPGTSAEQTKERTDKLNKLNADIKKAADARKQLLNEIAQLFTDGNPKLSDAERDKLDKLQKDLVTTMTQVASSEDLQLKANARVTLRAQQQSARDSHHTYDNLLRRFNTKIAEAQSLINTIADLNARAREF